MCRGQLSAVLERESHGTDTNHADRAAFVPCGSVHQSDGEFFTGTEGRYIINLADRRNLTVHKDPKRLAGCCGMDGCDGPNQLCACGAEVATEKSDCWMPHALIFESGVVELVEVAG
jgi:hypothetical protein